VDKFVVCVCGVDSARLLQNQTAYARVLLLGGLQYIAQHVEFLEQAFWLRISLAERTRSAIHMEIQYGSMWTTCIPLMT
jgi:hypothetical protein